MPIINYQIRLRAISMFLERAFKVDDEYIEIINKDYTQEKRDDFEEVEHDDALDALLFYQEIVTRAMLWELNALVEYELKWTAKSIQRKHHGKSLEAEKKIGRERACKIIEDEYQIKLEDLSGFNEVDEIRKISNAFKHDDGYSGNFEPFFIGSIEKKYELDPELAKKYLSAVNEFLRALPGKRLLLGKDVRTK